MAISTVVSGTPARTVATNPSTTPPFPSGCAAGDELVIFDVVVTQGGTPATPSIPSGWDRKTSAAQSDVRISWYYRPWQSGLNAPTITVTGASSTQHISIMARLRGAKLSGDPTDMLGTFSGGSSSTQMGPISGVTSTVPGGAVLIGAARGNDLSDNQPIDDALSQAGLSFTRLYDWGAISSENMAGAFSVALLPNVTTVTNKSYSTTTTGADIWAGQMWVLLPENTDIEVTLDQITVTVEEPDVLCGNLPSVSAGADAIVPVGGTFTRRALELV